MPVILLRQEPSWLIKLEGQITVTSALQLKELLLEWVSAGTDLDLDLERAEEVDVTIMQLLWAAAREGAGAGRKIVAHASSAATAAARDSGFAQLPGFPVAE